MGAQDTHAGPTAISYLTSDLVDLSELRIGLRLGLVAAARGSAPKTRALERHAVAEQTHLAALVADCLPRPSSDRLEDPRVHSLLTPRGADLDRRFVELLVASCRAGLEIAGREMRLGSDPRCRAAAEETIRHHSRTLQQAAVLRQHLSGNSA